MIRKTIIDNLKLKPTKIKKTRKQPKRKTNYTKPTSLEN